MTKAMLTACVASVLCGCLTVHHCEYPEVVMSQAPAGAETRVQLSGFEATITSYVPVYGHETVWRPSHGYWHHGRYRGYGGMSTETYTTTTYIPQTNPTTAFVEQAQDRLENAGFLVNGTNAAYRVEVKFSGPTVTDGERSAQLLWLLCSALSADYGVQTWTAKLRIYDVASGKLLMHNDYSERYTAVVWGPIPILSPAGSDQTDSTVMQSWCLSALTDRAMADASAFLSSVGK